MPNETNEVMIEGKPSSKKSSNWGKIGILFSTLGVVIFICAFGYGYSALARSVTGLQQSMDTLRQTVEKIQQKSQEPVAQDQATNELYLRLIAVDGQLDQLPLWVTSHPIKMDEQQTIEKPVSSWWQAGLERFWQSLRKIVIVRYIDSNSVPLVSPEEKSFLYQNLHAQMESAIWGALHHNATVYQNSLARAIAWTQRYFIQDAVQTKNILQALQDLQKMNVSVTAQ